jgi:hypothetical protein
VSEISASFGSPASFVYQNFKQKGTMRNLSSLDWEEARSSLSAKGYASLPNLLSKQECDSMCDLYGTSALFRSVIDMQRYRFGKGEYKYFKYPLPAKMQSLREEMYEPLSIVANDWMRQLKLETVFPEKHIQLLEKCHLHGQVRPTPLILRYETGGYNTLHQDLYGEIYFPFQVVIVLSQHGRDFAGGEFVLTEQIPRAQSKAQVLTPNQGDAVIFTTNFRPIQGTKGYYRANMKHGISEVKSGVRFAMGIIFHDAN